MLWTNIRYAGGLLWLAVGFCRGFIQICNYPKCIRPYLHLGAGNFKFVIFTNFSTFNPASLIASSAMQIQLQLPPSLLLPQYVIREFRLQKSVIPNPTKRLCSTNMQSHLKICFWPILLQWRCCNNADANLSSPTSHASELENSWLIFDVGDVADWYRYSCWLLPGGHWSPSPTPYIYRPQSIYGREQLFSSHSSIGKVKGIWSQITPAKNDCLCCSLSFRVPNLSSHSLVETQDGAGSRFLLPMMKIFLLATRIQNRARVNAEGQWWAVIQTQPNSVTG